MKRLQRLGTAGVLAWCALAGDHADSQELVPAARNQADGRGRFRLSSGIAIGDEALRPQAEALADGLHRLGMEPVELLDGRSEGGKGRVLIELGELPAGITYRISVREAALHVEVEDGHGAAQAAASLLQLASFDD